VKSHLQITPPATSDIAKRYTKYDERNILIPRASELKYAHSYQKLNGISLVKLPI
jgi:hypothetical protein